MGGLMEARAGAEEVGVGDRGCTGRGEWKGCELCLLAQLLPPVCPPARLPTLQGQRAPAGGMGFCWGSPGGSRSPPFSCRHSLPAPAWGLTTTPAPSTPLGESPGPHSTSARVSHSDKGTGHHRPLTPGPRGFRWGSGGTERQPGVPRVTSLPCALFPPLQSGHRSVTGIT